MPASNTLMALANPLRCGSQVQRSRARIAFPMI
jgi:hypothetical protein